MSFLYFKISGSEAKAVDATTNFTTDAFTFDNSIAWSVSLKDNGVVGSPTYSVEVSNNGSTWYVWSATSSGLSLNAKVNDDNMPCAFMRVNYVANAASEGTIDVELGINSFK
jgi:hypothetical protein